jgi:recombination protein RecA
MDRDFINSFRKEFGQDTIFILGQDEKFADIKVRSSGSLLLDIALGGGFAKGRLILLQGPEKAGKTSIACMAIAEAQQTEPEKSTAIIDLEQSLNLNWAYTLGVDTEKLMILQPDTYAEKVYDMLEYMIKSEKFSVIVLDSVDALIPKDEFEETDWDKESRVGGIAKLNSKAIRKIINSGLLKKSETTLIFIQQIRDKIGGFSLYGNPTTTSGGRSLKHASTQTLEVAIGDYFTKGSGLDKKYFGQQIRVKVSKNKIAPPYRQATIDIYYEHGVDKITELVAVAKELGILQGSNWLKFVNPATGEAFLDKNGNEYKWNGLTKTKEALIEDIKNNNGEVYSILFETIQQVMRG